MLIAALVCAFVAFVAFVYYIAAGHDWTLVALYVAAGVGLTLFIADWWVKHRADRARKGGEAFIATAESQAEVADQDGGELPDVGETGETAAGESGAGAGAGR